MLVNSWYRSADVQILMAHWSSFVLLIMVFLTWRVVLVLAVVVNANELHKWSHRTKAENGRFITWLQDHGIIQSRAHHGRHHGGARNSHYCTVTPWLNPLLDCGGLWRGIEAGIRRCTGMAPRSHQAGISRFAGDERIVSPHCDGQLSPWKTQLNRDGATNATDFTGRTVASCVHRLGEARVRRKLLRRRAVAPLR